MKIYTMFVVILLSVSVHSQWRQIEVLNAGKVNSVSAFGQDVYVNAEKGIFISSDNGISWNLVNNGLTGTAVNSFVSDDTSSFATTNAGIFKSTNGGKTWVKVYSRDTKVLGINGNKLFALFSGRSSIFSSTDEGVNWKETSQYMFNIGLSTMAVNGNTIIVGADDRHGILFRSLDGGSYWSLNSDPEGYINAIIFKDNIAFVGADAGMYLSKNNGQNFTLSSRGLIDKYISSIAVQGNNVYAGSSAGSIYLSTDNGANWKQFGLQNAHVFSIAANNSSIFATTLAGLYSYTTQNNNSKLQGFDLVQNYPNPFNPATTISYSIPKQSFVELKVYDMLGREVTTLVKKEQNDGVYSVKFDGSTLPSGIYIYTIQAGEFRNSKKLMLLK